MARKAPNTNDQLKLFGIKVFEKHRQENQDQPQTFAPDINDDGAAVLERHGHHSQTTGGAGFSAYSMDLAGSLQNEISLIRKYRKMATNQEADAAIDDVVNEAIVQTDNQPTVELNLDQTDLSQKIQETIKDEFDNILTLLNFEDRAYRMFRQWYIDGRMYIHKIIDHSNPKKGLIQLKRVDPLQMKKVREYRKEKHDHNPNLNVVEDVEEYFIFNEKGLDGDVGSYGVKIAPESVTFVHSGLVDEEGKIVISNLHKALRPLNQLRMMEDSAVIYRISRAPERRVFYIDVGNMPTSKSEQYVQDIMNRYKNRLTYDASTGDIQSDRRHMHMMEDFFLPRREGSRGTEIDTLQGGQNLGEIEDIQYFQKEFYKSLNVPVSRLDPDSGNELSRGAEINRDELKFKKFINRLQQQFSHLFLDLLGTQLILKKIISYEEWCRIKPFIKFNYAEDSYFAEAKNAEMMQERLTMLRDMDQYVGKYFSKRYVQENILRMSEDEVEQIEEEIKQEIEQGKIKNPDEDEGGMF